MVEAWTIASTVLIGAGFSLVLTPLALVAARRLGLVDKPNQRRLNTTPMPTGGGIAFFVSCLLAIGLSGYSMWPLAPAAVLLLLVGLVDDYHGLKPGLKLIGQISAAVMLVWFGPRVEYVVSPAGSVFDLGAAAIPLTVFWVVALTNVINFIDGLDGLASGLALIAALALLAIALQTGQWSAALLASAVAGSLIGFLPYNVHPAKIFLGDAGAMLLGLFLAVTSIEGAWNGSAAVSFAVPIAIFALPFVDASCAIIRRLQQGMPIYEADRGHFHHRMLAAGFSQRQVAWLAYGIGFLSASVSHYTMYASGSGQWLLFVFVSLLFFGAFRIGLVLPVRIKPHRRVL